MFVTGTPLALFGHPLWIDFFSKLRPSFKLPGRKLISTRLLDNQFNIMEKDIKQILADAPNLSLQCDGWSNCRNESIINFMISYPKPLFVKFLETKESTHSAEYLCAEMEKVMIAYGPEKLLVVIGDNAANVQCALKLLNEKYTHIIPLGCVSHLMHLLCGDIMKSTSSKQIFSSAKFIIKKVRRSHLLCALFSKIQKENDIVCALKLPGVTRWGSIQNALESLLINRTVLQIMIVNDVAKSKFPANVRKQIAGDDLWKKINLLVNVLKPITLVNIGLEGDSVLIQKLHPLLSKLESDIRPILQSTNFFTQTEQKNFIVDMKQRKEYVIKPIHLAAVLLNPIDRGTSLNGSESIDAMEFVFVTAQNIKLDTCMVLNEIGNYKNKEGMWNKEFVWTAVNTMCPLRWWKTFYSQSPLSIVAVRILSAPITSAATERANSTFGWIHNNKRNRLKTQRAGKITYLAHNWNLMNNRKKDPNRKPSTADEPSTSQSQSRISDASSESDYDADTETDSEMSNEPSSAQISQSEDEQIS